MQPGCRVRSSAQKHLPRLTSKVLEGCGASVVVHEIAHTLICVLHLPAGWQWQLLDHPANKEGVTRKASHPQLWPSKLLPLGTTFNLQLSSVLDKEGIHSMGLASACLQATASLPVCGRGSLSGGLGQVLSWSRSPENHRPKALRSPRRALREGDRARRKHLFLPRKNLQSSL